MKIARTSNLDEKMTTPTNLGENHKSDKFASNKFEQNYNKG